MLLQNPLTIWKATFTKKVVEDSAVHFAIDILLKNLKRKPAIKTKSHPRHRPIYLQLGDYTESDHHGISFTRLPPDTNFTVILETSEPELIRLDDSLKLRPPKDLILSPSLSCLPVGRRQKRFHWTTVETQISSSYPLIHCPAADRFSLK